MSPNAEPPPVRRLPLSLVRCDPERDERACGLLQMSITVPQEILYSTYWYRSGTNRTMRDHLAGIAGEATALLARDEARVLDIGCNDGTLLDAYPDDFVKFGIDPSNAVEVIDDERVTVVQDVFPSVQLTSARDGVPFDIITSIAMFYDVEDPAAFVRSIKECLSPDGVWLFEMSYMPMMLSNNSYDTICHEHLAYYSLAVIEQILTRASMKVFDVGLNDINGGSIRCFATHSESRRYSDPLREQRVHRLRLQEFDLELDSDKPYARFREAIEAHREELGRMVRSILDAGERIHVYGASTKGNTILQFCGLDAKSIECAADRNPDKHGTRTIGTDIPIVSEEESRAMRPDYYLVLPWHFKSEFVERERETLRAGAAMIFPLPEIEVVRT